MIKHNQKHLTLSNRIYIEQELLQKSSFSSIGSTFHKDPTTIAKEVKRYSKTVPLSAKGVTEETHLRFVRISYRTPVIRSRNHLMSVTTAKTISTALSTRKSTMLLMPKNSTKRSCTIPAKAST